VGVKAENHADVSILIPTGAIEGDSQKVIFRCLLVFRFDSHVKDTVRAGIGVNDHFGAASVSGGATPKRPPTDGISDYIRVEIG